MAEALAKIGSKKVASQLPEPAGYRILIALPTPDEKTEGGVWKPVSSEAADQVAQTKGVLIAVSPMAFINPDWPEGAVIPKVGDLVSYARYAGATSKIKGADGVGYIIIKDKEITAIITSEADE